MSKIGELINVYDTETDKYVLENATREEAEKVLGVDGKKISYSLYSGYRIKGRYITERAKIKADTKSSVDDKDKKPKIPQRILDEWDTVRLSVNPGARRC